ncbi:vesicle-associated hypothetical protein [Limosa lapponica baueri]|uniref:V-SNARE coiled-coil homology domain-containing protein n=1 Tax=Limosa lapponica baueri TaxID=1758121 RepID=A0A2I0TXF8_LIMLA|nr:vesicle-associated hypothetical protein [Limosa lapponica baueri]
MPCETGATLAQRSAPAPTQGPTGAGAAGPPPATNVSSNKRLQQTQARVDEVVDIMRMNVDKVLERDQKLSELDNRADALQAGASQFETSAAKLKRKYWWKNCKMMIILGVVCAVILIIIITQRLLVVLCWFIAVVKISYVTFLIQPRKHEQFRTNKIIIGEAVVSNTLKDEFNPNSPASTTKTNLSDTFNT